MTWDWNLRQQINDSRNQMYNDDFFENSRNKEYQKELKILDYRIKFRNFKDMEQNEMEMNNLINEWNEAREEYKISDVDVPKIIKEKIEKFNEHLKYKPGGP